MECWSAPAGTGIGLLQPHRLRDRRNNPDRFQPSDGRFYPASQFFLSEHTLHRRESLLDHGCDIRCGLVRQQIRDPHSPSSIVCFFEELK